MESIRVANAQTGSFETKKKKKKNGKDIPESGKRR